MTYQREYSGMDLIHWKVVWKPEGLVGLSYVSQLAQVLTLPLF